MDNDELPDPDFDYDDDEALFDSCPCCGRDYDEIDYEYQICFHCGYGAEDKN